MWMDWLECIGPCTLDTRLGREWQQAIGGQRCTSDAFCTSGIRARLAAINSRRGSSRSRRPGGGLPFCSTRPAETSGSKTRDIRTLATIHHTGSRG